MSLNSPEIREFLRLVGAPDLFAWLGITWSASQHARSEALKKRRKWAQGQQSNPKHGSAARWVIRHQAELQRLLVDKPETYRLMLAEELRAQGEHRLKELVDSFGTDDVLSEDELRIVERYAWRQGLEAEHTRELLEAWGCMRSPSTDDGPRLDDVIHEVLANGKLSSHELGRILEMGRVSNLPEAAIALLVLDRVKAEAS